jgi:hypothetical protein
MTDGDWPLQLGPSDLIYRRLPSRSGVKKTGAISSSVFEPRRGKDGKLEETLSVDVAQRTTPEETAELGGPHFGVCEVTVGDLPEAGPLKALHTPQPDNDAHGDITGVLSDEYSAERLAALARLLFVFSTGSEIPAHVLRLMPRAS